MTNRLGRSVVYSACLLGLLLTACSEEAAPEPTLVANEAQSINEELKSILGENGPKTSTIYRVEETMDAGGYTYARLKNGKDDRWVAAPQVNLKVGQEVTLGKAAVMENFKSPSLNRSFDLIYFANSIDVAGAKPAAAPVKEVVADVSKVVKPASGGVTVEQILTNAESISEDPVRVRGQVVKFNAQIMGRNWIHIQDGSGTAKAGTHDLTITTKATVRVGSQIEATGKLSKNKDFGAGYSYSVLMEDATIEVLQ